MVRVRVEQRQRLGKAAVGSGVTSRPVAAWHAVGEQRQHQARPGVRRPQAVGVLAVIEESEIARARVGERAHVFDAGCPPAPAPGASSAPVALATSASVNGPARSKNPGCSMP